MFTGKLERTDRVKDMRNFITLSVASTWALGKGKRQRWWQSGYGPQNGEVRSEVVCDHL